MATFRAHAMQKSLWWWPAAISVATLVCCGPRHEDKARNFVSNAPVSSGAGISFIQAAGLQDYAPGLVAALAFDSPTTAGDLIVVAASWGDDSALDFEPSASDSAGNRYVLATKDFESSDRQSLAVFYAANVAGGPTEVTVRFNAPGYPFPNGEEEYRSLIIAEYSGVEQTSPLIATSQRVLTTGCSVNQPEDSCPSGDFQVTSGQVNIAVPGALIFGAMENSSYYTDRAAGAGFTQRATDSPIEDDVALDVQDLVLAAPGPAASIETWQLNSNHMAQMLAFRPVGSSVPTPPSDLCGDGLCGSSESCTSCSADCGACAPPPTSNPPTPDPPPSSNPPPQSETGIAFVQAAGFQDYEPGLTAQLTFPAPTTAGNLIVVAASWGDDSALEFEPTATDDRGNTYVLATKDFESVDRQSLAIFYAANIAGGVTEVTVHFNAPGYPDPNGAEAYRSLIVAEYRGLAKDSPLVATSERVLTSGCNVNEPIESCPSGDFEVTSGAVDVSAHSALVFGAMENSAYYTDRASGPGFTQRAVDSSDEDHVALDVQDLVLTAPGSIASTETWQLNSNHMAQMVVFRAACNL
jgi:hypothetical protein